MKFKGHSGPEITEKIKINFYNNDMGDFLNDMGNCLNDLGDFPDGLGNLPEE
jgi:hypothetical protein